MNNSTFSLFLTLSTIINVSIAMEQNISESFPLHKLPNEIQSIIAGYLSYSNNVYESDASFKRRVQKMDLKENTYANISENEFIYVNDNSSLELVTIEPLKKTKIIRSNCDNKLLYNVFLKIGKRKNFVPENRVDFFALSPNKRLVAALVNNNRIETYSVEHKSNDALDRFLLSQYYEKEGLVGKPSTNFDQHWEYLYRGYITKKEYAQFRKGYQWTSDPLANWHNPVRVIAVSNASEIAFANDRKVFLVEKCKDIFIPHMKHEDALQDIGPFYVNGVTEKLFIEWKSGNIIAMAFNKQSSKLALVYHILSDVSVKKSESPKHDASEKKSLNIFTIRLIECMLRQQYDKFSEIEDTLTSFQALPFDEYLEKLKTIIPKELYSLICESSPTINNYNHIKIISTKEEKPWDLATYFRLKGICKDWNQHVKRKQKQ